MRVSRSDTICGLGAPAARQLMRAYWDERPAGVELRIILRNRSPVISITGEDIRKLTERFEVVYAVGDDPMRSRPAEQNLAAGRRFSTAALQSRQRSRVSQGI